MVGGQFMTRKEIKQWAKSALKGKVFVALLPLVIYAAITGVFGAIGGSTFGIGALTFILLIPIQVGLAIFFIKFAKDEKVGLEDLFSQFKDFSRMFEQIKGMVLRWVYIFLGLILFIVPGIIFSLRYSLLNYVFANNPQLDYSEAMKKCKEMMKGRIGEYFVLLLSFIGWFILGALTFGILYIYIAPYFELTKTKYYLEICGQCEENDKEATIQPELISDAKENNDDSIF